MEEMKDRPEAIHPESVSPPILFHNEPLMFWGAVAMISVLAGIGIFLREQFGHFSITEILLMWGFGCAVLALLRYRGAFEDNPQEDVRAFARGGRYFLIGAAFGAIYFFGDEGFAWLTAYDLTDVNFQTGFQPLSKVSESVGLAGFLEKLVRLVTISLGAGAVANAAASKMGLEGSTPINSAG